MKFSEMTPEQFEHWMTEVRPALVAMRERQEVRNREAALRLIRRPARNTKPRNTEGNQMENYEIGDRIEHNLMPGFVMTVQATDKCETDSARPEDHLMYQVTDPEGNTDWLCAYDVRRA